MNDRSRHNWKNETSLLLSKWSDKSTPFAKTYRKSLPLSGLSNDPVTFIFSLKDHNNKLRVNSPCLLCRTELVPEKTAVERLKANDLSTAAGKSV